MIARGATGIFAVLMAGAALAPPPSALGAAVYAAPVLVVDASAVNLEAGPHRFGFAEGAGIGIDGHDQPEPPSPPADFLALFFRMPGDQAALPNRWRDDIRSPADFADGVELWALHLESDQLGADCTLTFTMPDGDPGGLRLRLLSQDGQEASIGIPGQIMVPLAAPDQILWIELCQDAIPVHRRNWGAVKAVFAR